MFLIKSIVQCADELNHKKALKFRIREHCRPVYGIETMKTRFHRPIISFLMPAD